MIKETVAVVVKVSETHTVTANIPNVMLDFQLSTQSFQLDYKKNGKKKANG